MMTRARRLDPRPTLSGERATGPNLFQQAGPDQLSDNLSCRTEETTMKLQLTLIDDGIPVDRDNPVIPIVDTNGKLLGNLTWVQRYVGRSEIPLPHQVLTSCPIKITQPWERQEMPDGSVVWTQWEVQ